MKSIYAMELHDTIISDDETYIVIRVPTGWVYHFIIETETEVSCNSVFVPAPSNWQSARFGR